MVRSRLLLGLALFAALPACANEKDSGDDVTIDSGKKDSGAKDSSVDDTSTPGTDTGGSTTDTGGTSETTPVDSGGSCDQHTGDECNMVKQDCADATKTCAYDDSVGHNTCQAKPLGTKGKGESCTSSNDCDKGLFCYSNKCSPACCSGDNSVCGAGGACNLAITNSSDTVIYHACSYSAKCNPFKYDCPAGQVCLFSSEPDVFKCSEPSKAGALGTAPGVSCTYVNDCGESQACFTSGTGDAAVSQCRLFCWLMTPDGFSVGSTPGGRFPANGTCSVGGTSYGTCQSVSGIGGGLGICVK